MKICFLSDPGYVHMQRWASYFSNRGHEVTIIGNYSDRLVTLPGIKTYLLEIFKFKGPWILKNTLALKELLGKVRPDILHMHYLCAQPSPLLLRFKPLVISVWGADILSDSGLIKDSWREKVIKRSLLRTADGVIASSQFLAKATSEYAKLSVEKIMTYYWGVDRAEFSGDSYGNQKKASNRFVLGFVKHLTAKYGAEYLLRAVRRVKLVRPNVDLTVLIIGDGPLRGQLEALARELKIETFVTFVGEIPHSLVPRYLSEMDVFLMPSIHESETFGIAAVEAQAMGVPVIASRIGGVPEAISHGVTGLLVRPRDEIALSEAVIKLLDNPRLRESMCREGPPFVAKNFDWHINAARVEEFYESLSYHKKAVKTFNCIPKRTTR